MNTNKITSRVVVNGLRINATDNCNEFFCQEMAELPQLFNAANADEAKLQEEIDGHINMVAKAFEKRYSSKEEHDAVSEEERLAQGKEIFMGIVAGIKTQTEGMNPFDKLLFWTGWHWWYYNRQMTEFLIRSGENKHWDNATRILKEMVMPHLHPNLLKVVGEMELCNMALGFGHFAILLQNRDEHIRRIITDTQLFEIHDARGYTYLDITPEGKPIARFVTSLGGERAFFDGRRLMTHDQFRTCAPKTTLFSGGYKVNSTRCTIINGKLYPLIDEDDKVAQTTGAFMGMVDWSLSEFLAAQAMAEKSAGCLELFENGNVILEGKTIKPLGMFQQSEMELLNSGFTLCKPSHYIEFSNCQYSTVMIVDDRKDWIKTMVTVLGEAEDGGPESMAELLTTDKVKALAEIQKVQPDALILDVHLTSDEQFDGLWIANQLFRHGFQGFVMLASSYPDEQLGAMMKLVGGANGNLAAPGKNPERILKLLAQKR